MMIDFKIEKKFKQWVTLAIMVSFILGITTNILAQSDSEQTSDRSKNSSEKNSETNRGLPNTDVPENLPDAKTIENSNSMTSENSNDNPFAPTVVRGTPRRSSPSDIIKTLENDDKFQTLLSILELANLSFELEKPGFLVLFAPTEEAFNHLPPELYNRLILPENRSQLIELIKNHFVLQQIQATDLERGEIKTLTGTKIRVKVNSNGEVQLNETTTKKDEFIQTRNGLIVPVDQVLFIPNLDIENSTTQTPSTF